MNQKNRNIKAKSLINLPRMTISPLVMGKYEENIKRWQQKAIGLSRPKSKAQLNSSNMLKQWFHGLDL